MKRDYISLPDVITKGQFESVEVDEHAAACSFCQHRRKPHSLHLEKQPVKAVQFAL